MSQHAYHIHPALPDEFWNRIQSSPRRLLMLDYDGTLAPFHVQRMDALPSPETLRALREILHDAGTYVAVISGRRIAELETLLGPVRLHLVGEHGWEERTPDGRNVLHALPGPAAYRLGQAVRSASASGCRELLERKRCSVVLHTRGIDVPQARLLIEKCGRLWSAFYLRDGLELLHIDGGLELRATHRNKGLAVRDLIAGRPGDSLPVYLGDDSTDEDAFVAVSDRGIALRVGSQHETIATWSLPSQEAVLPFLQKWAALVGDDEGARPSP